MKLVNCPVCGTRCTADTEKCPECGFDIRKYFTETEKVPAKRKKQPYFKAAFALAVILIIFLISIPLLTRNSDTSSGESINEETGENEVKISGDQTKPSPAVPVTAQESAAQKALSSEASSHKAIDVSGVYRGNDHEVLVLDSDGLAYYFCTTIQYTEMACPWYIIDDTVYIELSRLHCTIYAKLDESDLIFKSDSINWNPELFTKINLKPEEYLVKLPATNDPKATLNLDGTISYTNDGITYVLPKMFQDFEDVFDQMENSSSFIDQDYQSDYIGSAVFHSQKGSEMDEALAKSLTEKFASGFYSSITLSDCIEAVVAGHKGFRFNLRGNLNKGFNPMQGYEVDGFIVIFHNESTGNNNYIMMIQTSHRDLDDTLLFEDILKSAK